MRTSTRVGKKTQEINSDRAASCKHIENAHKSLRVHERCREMESKSVLIAFNVDKRVCEISKNISRVTAY